MSKNLTKFVKSLGGGGNPLPYEGQHVFEWAPTSQGQCACNFGANWVSWCVPPQISTATFHVWGAGGYGSGGTGCGVGIPGGSGAYAYKTVAVTPGTCYAIHAGVKRACHTYQAAWEAGNVKDSDHGTTYVVGAGLTNFCAQGGNHAGFVCCTALNFATLFDSATPYYTNGDSAGGPNRACYYGADDGIRGTKGYVTTSGVGIATGLCQMRFWVPLPGCSTYAKLGGHIQVAACQNQMTPDQVNRYLALNMEQGYCGGAGLPEAAGQNLEMVGMGSPGITTCAGLATNGSLNMAGKIRILFS